MVNFMIGIFNGTQLVQDEADMEICANALVIDIVGSGLSIKNETLDGSIFRGLYATYDIIYSLHPLVHHCRKTFVDAYYGNTWLFDDIDDIRRVIDNLVHNFSFIMDAILDVNSFFNSGERGQHYDGPYDAGYGIGMVVFYLLADDSSGLMVDPAEGATMPLRFDWGLNIARWKDEDRIRKEQRDAARAAAAAAADLPDTEGIDGNDEADDAEF